MHFPLKSRGHQWRTPATGRIYVLPLQQLGYVLWTTCWKAPTRISRADNSFYQLLTTLNSYLILVFPFQIRICALPVEGQEFFVPVSPACTHFLNCYHHCCYLLNPIQNQ